MGSRESRSRMREACGGCKMKKEYYEEKETETQNNYLEKKQNTLQRNLLLLMQN